MVRATTCKWTEKWRHKGCFGKTSLLILKMKRKKEHWQDNDYLIVETNYERLQIKSQYNLATREKEFKENLTIGAW